MSPEFPDRHNDARLLALDFLHECGHLIASFGLAVAAAASAERLDVLENALRQTRQALLDAIEEFKRLAETDGGAE